MALSPILLTCSFAQGTNIHQLQHCSHRSHWWWGERMRSFRILEKMDLSQFFFPSKYPYHSRTAQSQTQSIQVRRLHSLPCRGGSQALLVMLPESQRVTEYPETKGNHKGHRLQSLALRRPSQRIQEFQFCQSGQTKGHKKA